MRNWLGVFYSFFMRRFASFIDFKTSALGCLNGKIEFWKRFYTTLKYYRFSNSNIVLVKSCWNKNKTISIQLTSWNTICKPQPNYPWQQKANAARQFYSLYQVVITRRNQKLIYAANTKHASAGLITPRDVIAWAKRHPRPFPFTYIYYSKEASISANTHVQTHSHIYSQQQQQRQNNKSEREATARSISSMHGPTTTKQQKQIEATHMWERENHSLVIHAAQ
jgi:hypothetical protein